MTTQLLLKILDYLDDKELSRFQLFLQQPNNVQGCPAMTKSQLQTLDRSITVTGMIQTYGDQEAVQVTRVVLEKISRKDLLQRFPASSPGPEERDTEQSVQPQIVQPQIVQPQRVQPKDWLSSVRTQLIDRLSTVNVNQLLDRLYQEKVFNAQERDEVNAENTAADKARKLIEGVERKGPEAVSHLKTALHEVNPCLCRTLNLT